MNKQDENIVESVAEVAEDVVGDIEEVLDETSKKSLTLRIIAMPFKALLSIGKFGIKRLKIFGSKFRRYTNYATDDEKGPIIRFTSSLFFRIGALFGIVGGIALQHYLDVVQFVIDLFT